MEDFLMIYCSRCGASLTGNEDFCPKCGNNLTNSYQQSTAGVSSKSRLLTLLLAIFFGLFGVHRFYTGKFWTGILMILLNATGIGEIWCIIDIIFITVGEFKDKCGNKVLVW